MSTFRVLTEEVSLSPGITAREVNSLPHRKLRDWTINAAGAGPTPQYIDRFPCQGGLYASLANLPGDTKALVLADPGSGEFVVWHFATNEHRNQAAALLT